MSRTKQTRKELIEIDARLNELERMRPYIKTEVYYERKAYLQERKEKLEDKVDAGRLAPDVQYITMEEGD